MKLQQGQIWKCAAEYVRIVHLERLEVGYKSFKTLKSPAGVHKHTSKKDFCRLLKGAVLLSTDKPAEDVEKRPGDKKFAVSKAAPLVKAAPDSKPQAPGKIQ